METIGMLMKLDFLDIGRAMMDDVCGPWVWAHMQGPPQRALSP